MMTLLVSSYMDMVRATARHYEGGEGFYRVTNAFSRFGVWYVLVIFPVALTVVCTIGLVTTLLGI